MELVRFYACEGDPLRVALMLVRKAMDQAQRTWICGPVEQLERLSQQIWAADGFLAHAGPQASASVRQRSKIVLGAELPSQTVDVLLNLGAAVGPDAPARRLLDLVGPDDAARAAGRERYRRHVQAGISPESVRVPA
jgi:DNA polymerase IIIc chi subunit